MLKHDDGVRAAGRADAGSGERHGVEAVPGHRAGGPIGAIEAIIKVVEGPDPPRHPPPGHDAYGHDAYEGAMAALLGLREHFEAREAASRGAGPPAESAGRAARSEEHRGGGA